MVKTHRRWDWRSYFRLNFKDRLTQAIAIHELMFDTSWHHNNLTTMADASNSPAGVGSMLAGYVTGFNEQQHVIYIGFDNHVHELMHDGGWHHSDLSAAAGDLDQMAVAHSPYQRLATTAGQALAGVVESETRIGQRRRLRGGGGGRKESGRLRATAWRAALRL